jgi:hypothetical protein
MKHFFTIAIFFLFQYTICAQFNLTIPGGRIASVTRVEDTLYFWGENYIWRSTDWGATVTIFELLSSYNDYAERYPQGSTGVTSLYSVKTWTQDNTFYRVSEQSNNGGINFSRQISYYSPKYKTGGDYAYSEMVFAPEFPFLGLRDNNLFVSLGNGYNFKFITENGIKRNVNIGTTAIPVPDLVNYQTYGNGKIIGFKNNDLKIINLQDSITTTIQVGDSLKLNKFEFQNIYNGNICLFNKDSSYYYLLNIESNILTRHNHLVFPFDKSYFYENQILYQKGTTYSVFNFSTGVLDVLNTSTINVSSGLSFLGKECIIVGRNNGKSFDITRDLGQSWVAHEDIAITSHWFNTIFDWNNTIYAIREGKLYKTPCDSTNQTMQYVHDVGSEVGPLLMSYPNTQSNCRNHAQVLENLDSVLFRENYRSIDLGKTWDTLPYQSLCFDYDNKQIIAFGKNSDNSVYLFKSIDLGQTWQEITFPIAIGTNISPIFVFHGDTIIGGGTVNPYFFISTDNGINFQNLTLQNANYYSSLLTAFYDNKIFSNTFSGGFFNSHRLNKSDGTNITSGVGLMSTYKNRLGLIYYDDSHFTFIQLKYQKYGARFPLNFNSFNQTLNVLKEGQFGVTDNFLHSDTRIYKFSNPKISLSTCEDSAQFQGIMYPIGQTVHTNNGCLMDTIIEVKKLPMIHPVLSACPENIVITSYGGPAIATWTPPTATIDCGGTVVPTSNYQSGATFSGGTTTVIYTAKDIQNNQTTCSFTVEVVLVLADLQIDSLDIPSLTTNTGTWLPFKYEIKNAGILDVAENLNVSYYLSTNNALTNLGSLRGSMTIDNLSINSSLVISDSIFIPSTQLFGDFYLKIKADDDNDIEELNEGNNVFVSQNTVQILKILPDLLIDSLNLPSLTVKKGSWLPFEYEIKNAGILDVYENLKVSYYLSKINSPNTLGTFRGSTTMDNLPINGSLVISDSIFIPTTQLLGDFYLKIKADDDNDIEELNEGNNVFVSSDKISVQQNIILGTLEGFDDDFNLIVLPNPANDFVNLHFTGLKHNQIDFENLSGKIVNQLGQIVEQFSFKMNNSEVFTLNLSDLINGIYFIEIETADKRTLKRKLIVSKK